MTRRDAAAIAILSGLCFLLFFFRLGAMDLWDIDEGMHASTSKDMVLTGDWLTPRFNGENFYDKPAFHNWLVAASFSVFGFTETAARLPAAILGLATVLLTFATGRRLFDRRTGLLAGVILASAVEFTLLSRMVLHDISLTFAVTLALAAFAHGITEEDAARRRRWWIVAWAGAGIAVLAKGPLGLLLLLLVVGPFIVLRRRWSLVREGLSLPGLAVFLVIALPWYLAMSLQHGDYVRSFLIEKNFGSFTGTARAMHPEPFYYYGLVLAAGFLPWTFFLPMAVMHAAGPGRQRHRDAMVLLLTWAASVLLFFSAANSKLGTYILPMFPALALMVAFVWRDLFVVPCPGLRRGFAISWSTMPVTAAVGLGGALVALPPKVIDTSGLTVGQVATILILSLGLGAWSFGCFLFRADRVGFWSIPVLMAAMTMYLYGSVGPTLNDRLSTKTLALELDRELPPGAPIPMFERIVRVGDTALFYTDRRAVALKSPDELHQFLERDDPVYCLVERKQLPRFESFSDDWVIVEERGNKVILWNGSPGT